MRKHWILLFCLGLVFINLENVSYTQGQEKNTAPKGSTGERSMEFRAVHRQTGEPLPNVALTVRVSTDNYKRRESWEEKTDSRGLCRIKLPDFQIETLRLYPKKKGFVPLFIMWRGIPKLPDVFTVAMEPSTTIGGIVRDEQGNPIEGVAVGVHYQTPDPKAAENVHVEVMIHNANKTDIRTDASGRWTFDKMPVEIKRNELRIFLKHPRYLSDQLRRGYIPQPITRLPSIENLRDFNAVMVMKKGLEVIGKVIDKQGQPIAGAKIFDTDNYRYGSTKPFAETDAQGQFLSNANPGTATWTIQTPGFAPDIQNITIKEGMSLIEFHLEPGNVIVGKVTDQSGKPIEGAGVYAHIWRRQRGRLHLEAKTDANGTFKVVDAPADEIVFNIGKEGFMLLEKYPMKAGDDHNITLRPTLKVRGTVLDAQTGQSINKFTVTNGYDHENGRAPQWERYSTRTFTDGQYKMEYMQEVFTYRIRVDAEGYQSGVSHRIRPEEIPENTIICDFKLEKSTPLEGIVLSPNGAPLSGANVVIATYWLHITNGKIDSRSSEQNHAYQTDSSGQFPFTAPIGHYMIVVLSEQGYAKVMPDEFMASRTITISTWGCLEGTLRIGAQPGIDKFIVFLPKANREREHPRIHFEYETQTDKNGHFIFPQLPPGEGTVARAIPLDGHARRYSYHMDIDIKSSQTTHVQIGGTGRSVIGKVIVPDLIENVFDWQYTDSSLRISSSIDPPYKFFGVECDEDGSFRVDDVPAGDYFLLLNAYDSPLNTRRLRGERIGILSHPFTIPEMPNGRSDEPLDLGELELQVIGKSELMPSLVGKPLPDLSEINFAQAMEQADGKMVLVCFFDMNQRPSRRCINQLTEQTTALNDKDVILRAIQTSKVDQDVLDKWVKKNNMSFPIGMIKSDEEETRFTWGVKSLPWLILTDKNHVVKAEGFAFGELDDKVAQIGTEN